MLNEFLFQTHDWSLFLSDIVNNPTNLFVLILSWYFSFSSLFLLRYLKETWQKTLAVHSHLFFLLFPIGFALFTWQCGMGLFQCAPMTVVSIALGLVLLSFLMGFFITPAIVNYLSKNKKLENTILNKFINSKSKEMGINAPSLFYLDTVTPQAYSYVSPKPSIYISLGLLEALNKKELEAVILHELGHIKNRSHIFRFSTLFSRVISPVVGFIAKGAIAHEEKIADGMTIKIQKTSKYLNSARKKIIRLEGELCA